MNNAPFYIGQKVIRIKHPVPLCPLGRVFVCAGCFKCAGCGEWKILLTELPAKPTQQKCTCSICRYNNGRYEYHVANCKYFSPIEENAYEDVRKELAVLPTDEVPDVKEIKELVN